MKHIIYVGMLLLCILIGLILLLLNIISWYSYLVVVAIVGITTWLVDPQKLNHHDRSLLKTREEPFFRYRKPDFYPS